HDQRRSAASRFLRPGRLESRFGVREGQAAVPRRASRLTAPWRSSKATPMPIHDGLAATAGRLGGGAVAIGNFDGVHLGHQALFNAARQDAQGTVCALTFEPHPARLLAPQYAPPLICERPRKRELIAACGVTDLIEQRFDAQLAATP